MSLRIRPYFRFWEAASVSAYFADIRMRNRADRKIMLVDLRYRREAYTDARTISLDRIRQSRIT